VVNATPRPHYPLKEARYLLYRRLGVPQGRSGGGRKISPPQGFDLRTAQLVVIRYTDYAISAHSFVITVFSVPKKVFFGFKIIIIFELHSTFLHLFA
jgi:hypothetical protein